MNAPDSPTLIDAGAGGFRVLEANGTRWLESRDGSVQSRMVLGRPDALALAYTRVMALALLFVPQPATALLLGLGGGSLVRFLLRQCPRARLTVVDSDPHVIELAHAHFEVPREDPRVRVHCADARDVDRLLAAGGFEMIMVDVFGHEGLPAWIARREFHDRARACLAPGGVLATNFWVDGDDAFLKVVGGMRLAFDGRLLLSDVERFLNLVAFGFGDSPPPLEMEPLRARATTLESATDIAYPSMLRRLAELNPTDREGFVL